MQSIKKKFDPIRLIPDKIENLGRICIKCDFKKLRDGREFPTVSYVFLIHVVTIYIDKIKIPEGHVFQIPQFVLIFPAPSS